MNIMRCSSFSDFENQLKSRCRISETFVVFVPIDFDSHLNESIRKIETAYPSNENGNPETTDGSVQKFNAPRFFWFTFGDSSAVSLDENSHDSQPVHSNIYNFNTLTAIFPCSMFDKIKEAMESEEAASETDSDDDGIVVKPTINGTSSMLDVIPPPPFESTHPTSPSSPHKEKKKSSTAYPQKALKVLIADDNLINQKVLERILTRVGVTDITIVDNGKKAVEEAEHAQFDCIFMDVEMPVMDGLTACGIISKRKLEKDQENGTKNKVVFVSGHDLDPLKHKGDLVGAYDYVSKPIRLQQINEFLVNKIQTQKKVESGTRSLLHTLGDEKHVNIHVKEPELDTQNLSSAASARFPVNVHDTNDDAKSKSPIEDEKNTSPRLNFLDKILHKTPMPSDRSLGSASHSSGSKPRNSLSSSKRKSPKRKSTLLSSKKKHAVKVYPKRDLKILIVEDNKINQKVIERILVRIGVTDITIVNNGQEAVDDTMANSYDLIFMDIQMPIMDGLTATRIICGRRRDLDDNHSNINKNIVFLTAHALVEFRDEAIQAGGIDFISKPYKMEQINELICRMEEQKDPAKP
jgi:CheY-like chemotaxis protein